MSLFDDLAPELAGETTARKDLFLSIAAQVHNAVEWGAIFEVAMTEFAAHLMTFAPGDGSGFGGGGAGGAGPITSKKAGPLSIGFGSVAMPSAGVAMGDTALTQTTHGLNYLMYRSTQASVAPFQVTV